MYFPRYHTMATLFWVKTFTFQIWLIGNMWVKLQTDVPNPSLEPSSCECAHRTKCMVVFVHTVSYSCQTRVKELRYFQHCRGEFSIIKIVQIADDEFWKRFTSICLCFKWHQTIVASLLSLAAIHEAIICFEHLKWSLFLGINPN